MNELTIEERLALTRLIGHDYHNVHAVLDGQALIASMGKPRTISPQDTLIFHKHLYNISTSVTLLSEGENAVMPGNFGNGDFDFMAKCLSVISKMMYKVEPEVVNLVETPTVTEAPLIYTVLINFIKNAKRSAGKDAKITLSAEPFFGLPNDAVYTPEILASSDRYIRFSSTDNGQGFPTDRSLADFAKLGVSTKTGREGGLGLAVAVMVCKRFGGVLGVNSYPGKTQVSLYVPYGK